jgi:hypothetical protein
MELSRVFEYSKKYILFNKTGQGGSAFDLRHKGVGSTQPKTALFARGGKDA